MGSTKMQARIAGLLYAVIAAVGPLTLVYIPGKLFAGGDPAATADRLRELETLVRWGIASEWFYQTVEVFLIVVLYGLFRSVSRPLALQMAILGLIPVPIVFLNTLNQTAALMAAKGARFFAGLEPQELDALAMMFVVMHGQGLQIAAVFWGLWLFPLGLLIIRCSFIPKLLGVSAMIAGAGYLISAVAPLVLPQQAGFLGAAAVVLMLGEPPIILWLLIWGATTRSIRPLDQNPQAS